MVVDPPPAEAIDCIFEQMSEDRRSPGYRPPPRDMRTVAIPTATAAPPTKRRNPYLSLWIAMGSISLHLTSWFPLAVIGSENHRNAGAMAIFEVFALLWILVPLGCGYGIVVGKRSLAAGEAPAAVWIGILLNGFYLMIGLFLLLILLSGVRV